MKWTTEMPTTPGFYWHRVIPSEPPEVVEVAYSYDRKLFLYRCGTKSGMPLDVWGGEWAGPLMAPKEVIE